MKKETSVLELVINGKQAETSINGLTNSIRTAEREFRKMRQADDPKAYAESSKAINVQKNALNEMRNSIRGVSKEASNWKDIAKGIVAGGFFQAGIGYLKEFASAAIKTYANFEKMGAVLTNALGSKSAANKALKDLQRFASETPFQLEELTGSYLKLVNRGMQPTMDQMTLMGDLAASQGKSFDMLTEAILDATTGEFERLKEFGIRASRNGDMVALSFKGLTQEVKLTGGAIQGALENFAAMPGVAGSMASMSATLSQAFSNFGDNVDMLAVKFGSATGGFIYNVVSGFSAIIGEMADTRTESERLTDELIKSDRGYKTLEKGVNGLLGRYDELKAKTTLNKTEQEELKTVINDLAEIVPLAATAFDKYGNAIDINKEKVQEFVNTQKELLKFQNADAIKATNKELEREILRQTDLTKELNTAIKTGMIRKDGGATFASNEDLSNTRTLLAKANDDIKNLRLRLQALNGDNLDILNTTDEKIKKQQEEQRLKDEAAAKAKDDAKQVANDSKEALKTADKAREKREKDIQGLKETLQKEFDALNISKMDDLDQIVANISAKYDPLIAKAKELNQIDLAKQLTALKDASVGTSASAFNKEDAAKQKKTDFETAKNIIATDNASQKVALSGEDLTPEQRAQIEYDLETERLLSLQILYRAFDESSLEYDQALADRKVAIKQKEVEDKQALSALMLETEIQTQLATADAVQAGASLIAGFLEQGSAAYKAFIMVEKIAAISQIIINLQKQISGIMTAAFLNPVFAADPTGLARTAFIAKNVAVAKITAGIGIATIGAQAVGALTAKKAEKRAKGGFIPDGPSHSNGGMQVLDGNGNAVAEIEGGEPILSRETYRNNQQTIDALLYSSQRLNGQKVNINNSGALSAERYFRSGGIIAPPDFKQNVSNNTNVDMSSTNQLLMQLIDKVQSQEVSLSLRMLEEEQSKRAAVINGASA
jgi:hypothetical protein